MEIRSLSEADFADWSKLWADYLRFYETELSLDIYRETFRRLVSEEILDLYGFGAFAPNLVGIAHLVFHPSTWRSGSDCYLEDLFVAAESRRSRVGSRLLGACAELARSRGVTRLYWLTKESNLAARALYDQVGELSPFVVYECSL